jgi:hypothetical protein
MPRDRGRELIAMMVTTIRVRGTRFPYQVKSSGRGGLRHFSTLSTFILNFSTIAGAETSDWTGGQRFPAQ